MDEEKETEKDEVDYDKEEDNMDEDEEESSVNENAGSDVSNDADGTDEKDDGSVALDTEKKNPTYYDLLNLWSAGNGNTVRFVSKGGNTRVYDFTNQKERMELQQLIASPPCGAQWTASHQIAKKSKKSESGKRGAKARKAYVPGFSTGSETASDEDANPAAKQPAQAPPEATGKKRQEEIALRKMSRQQRRRSRK